MAFASADEKRAACEALERQRQFASENRTDLGKFRHLLALALDLRFA